MLARAIVSTGTVIAIVVPAGAWREPEPARAFVARMFQLSAADGRRLDNGDVVARTLEAKDKREVATLGVVRIAITPEFYVEQFDDIATFKRTEAVLQVGAFSDSPQPADAAGLTLDEGDVGNLRGCRVGSCGMQLSAAAIEQFRRDVDWKRADAAQQANRVMRHILAGQAAEYLRSGSSPSMRYADRAQPLNLASEFTSMVQSDDVGLRQFPHLLRHLCEYPAQKSPDVVDRLYWAKEQVGRKTVVSMTHLAISSAVQAPVDYAIASKQIYSSHYFDASLGLTILLRDRVSPTPALYLIYVNRSRIDVLEGMFAPVTRRIVSSRARSTVSNQLTRLRHSLGDRFAGRAAQ